MCREAQGCIDTIKNNRVHVRLGIENGYVTSDHAYAHIAWAAEPTPHSKKKKIYCNGRDN